MDTVTFLDTVYISHAPGTARSGRRRRDPVEGTNVNTLIIDGHPNPDSLTAALARSYALACPDADLLAVRDLDIDPILHRGMRGEQPLEPDLVHAAERIVAADHVVIATPVWWDSTPALLKGFLDRVLQAGWAYRYRGGRPVGLLSGRSARILLTADSPWWYLRFVKHDAAVRQLRIGTLRFVGMRPVRVSRFLGVRTSDEARRAMWLAKAESLALRDSRRRRRHQPADPGQLVPRRQPAEDAGAASR